MGKHHQFLPYIITTYQLTVQLVLLYSCLRT